MKDVCWIDLILLLPVIYGLIRGVMRGLIIELNAVLAIVLGIIGARLWGPQVTYWIQQTSHWQLQVCSILAYITIFLIIAIVLNLIGTVFQKLLKAIKLDWINRLLGGLCGALKWTMIILVIIFIVGQTDQQFHILPNDLKEHSLVYQPMLDSANHIWKQVKEQQS